MAKLNQQMIILQHFFHISIISSIIIEILGLTFQYSGPEKVNFFKFKYTTLIKASHVETDSKFYP